MAEVVVSRSCKGVNIRHRSVMIQSRHHTSITRREVARGPKASPLPQEDGGRAGGRVRRQETRAKQRGSLDCRFTSQMGLN